jgi:hypothetical protein
VTPYSPVNFTDVGEDILPPSSCLNSKQSKRQAELFFEVQDGGSELFGNVRELVARFMVPSL